MAYMKDETGEEHWDDIFINSLALGTGVNAPSLVLFPPVTRMKIYSFTGTGSQVNELFGVVELLHSYKEGTDLHPHIHWTPLTATSGNVKWQLEWSTAANNALFPAGQISSGVSSVTPGQYNHIFTNLEPLISGTGLKIGSQLMLRIFRDPADSDDTFTGGAGLLSFGIHFQMDTFGSNLEYSKT
jgi:hypothetical protein